MHRDLLRTGLICLLFVIPCVVVGYLILPQQCVRGYDVDNYTISEPFDRVRKIMVRNDALRYIVEHQNAVVVNQKWQSLDFGTVLSGWQVTGSGEFSILTDDPEIGSSQLNFKQQVRITQKEFRCDTWLVSPVGNLKQMTTRLEMQGDAKLTRVKTTSEIVYQRRIPKRYVQVMSERVQRAVRRQLDSSRTAVLSLVGKYSGERRVKR